MNTSLQFLAECCIVNVWVMSWQFHLSVCSSVCNAREKIVEVFAVVLCHKVLTRRSMEL